MTEVQNIYIFAVYMNTTFYYYVLYLVYSTLLNEISDSRFLRDDFDFDGHFVVLWKNSTFI